MTSEMMNGLSLQRTAEGLVLTDGTLTLQADLTGMIPRIRRERIGGELLVRAARIKDPDREPFAIDATAGFGEDACLLAAAGFRVHLYEMDEVIADLLEDALARGSEVPELSEPLSRMTLFRENSIPALLHLSRRPDVILLDPMFPERQKSALVKKKFQLLQKLERPCPNEEELLEAAIAAKPHKIVIKRPLKGPNLAGVKPGYSIRGKAIRYDVIVLP